MKSIRFLVFLPILAIQLSGQSAEEANTRTIQFSFFAENNARAALSQGSDGSSGIPRLQFKYSDGESLIGVDKAADGFHGPYEGIVIDDTLRLYRPSLGTLEGAAGAEAVLAEIPIPGGWDEVLLYAYAGVGGVQPRFLPLSERRMLRGGRSLCMNLTGRPVAVLIGDQRFPLETNEIDEFDLSGAGESGLIRIKVAAEWQESWKPALSTSRRLRTDESYLFFFKANDRSSRLISLRIINLPELN